MNMIPQYPRVRYFREVDGTIGCRTIQSEAEEQPGWYDSPIRVPELAPRVAEAPSAGTSPVEDVRPAAVAPLKRHWGRKGHK